VEAKPEPKIESKPEDKKENAKVEPKLEPKPADTKQEKTDTPKTQDTRRVSIKDELKPGDEPKPTDERKGSVNDIKPFARRQSVKVRILNLTDTTR
jgi:hypothetical protein